MVEDGSVLLIFRSISAFSVRRASPKIGSCTRDGGASRCHPATLGTRLDNPRRLYLDHSAYSFPTTMHNRISSVHMPISPTFNPRTAPA